MSAFVDNVLLLSHWPQWRQRLAARFLEAYSRDPVVRRAAEHAGVHRASIYRWKADPAFVRAMEQAFAVWNQAHQARVARDRAEQERQHDRRMAELLPEMQARGRALGIGQREKKRKQC